MTQQDGIDGFATMIDGSTLVIQRWLPGPVERLWRFVTDDQLRRKWLAAGEMELVAGASLELVWRNDTLSEAADPRPSGFAEEERMQSRIIAVEPMRSLTIAWGDGAVTFTFKENGERVLLTITHSGLDDPASRRMIAGGWHMHLDILVAVCSGTRPDSFWSGWTKLQAIYDIRFSN